MSFRNVCLALQHGGAELVRSTALENVYVTRRLDGDVYWRVSEPGRIDVAGAPEGPWTAATYGITVQLNGVGQALTERERRNAMQQLDLALVQARDRAGIASAPNAEMARNQAQSGRGAAQSPSDLSTPIQRARAAGKAGMDAAEDRAAQELADFRDRCAREVLTILRDGVPRTGESIVDALKARGLTPTNDRAFGATFLRLQREGAITKAGFAPRVKGHGAPGATLWRTTQHP